MLQSNLPGLWLAHMLLAYVICCLLWQKLIRFYFFLKALFQLMKINAVFTQLAHSQPFKAENI